MNTVERLNAVIAYAEAHLTDTVDAEQMARIACMSSSDLQRLFSMIAEMPFSEYIRKRRMTLAAEELRGGGVRVIDIALKYGYDSPVSFARAFQSFHGIPPSAVKRAGVSLCRFPRLKFQIHVTEVMEVKNCEQMTVDGKRYEASYLGELDMSAWSVVYNWRKFWRLEDAWEDFKDRPRTNQILPYNNYPPVEIATGQVFVIDYERKKDRRIDRRYYLADGTVWQDMPSTAEIVLNTNPQRLETLVLCGRTYRAEYYGEQYIGSWSQLYDKRAFWRLRDAWVDFKDAPRTGEGLPYNNYPPMDIELGQVFVIEYETKSGDTERMVYLSDGLVWRDMPCTSQIQVEG